MTTYLDIVSAIPASGSVSKSLTRDALVKRVAYCLDDSEDLRTITVIDPDFGALPLYVMQQRRLFQYDSTDTTTAHDGTTCLVSAEGKRYKIDDFKYPWSVKSKTLTAPPVSPSVGDAYIVAPAATGAWAGQDNAIAVYSSRGWLFSTSPEGRHVYNEADGAFWYLNESGSWIRGPGALPFSSHSIPLSAMIGCAGSLLLRAVNQTTNTPPVSPSIGDCYIIGSSPTGAWAGNAGKIAICESGTSFTIYTPSDGDQIYDISKANIYRWFATSSAWVTASGQMKCVVTLFTSNGVFSKDARCVLVKVTVIGQGSGGGTGGASSSFGSHCSATGGTPTPSAGTGSGGDLNLTGSIVSPEGPVFGATYGESVGSGQGSGGAAIKFMQASDLLTNETVTVGQTGAAGKQGAVIVEQWIAI